MQAKIEDLDKVVEVTKEQINGSLKECPMNLQEFKTGLRSFSQVSESWREAIKSKTYNDLPSVKELKTIITPDILNLIQRQRLNCLVQGESFPKFKKDGNRERNKFVFVKLSPNHKNLYYGDWTAENETPSLEQLPNRILVNEINDFSTSQVRPKQHGITIHFNSADSPLDLVTAESKTFDFWCDGLNCLLRRDMKSAKVEEQLEQLLSLQIKLKLLHLNGIDIPNQVPEIPPLPSNYDFYHQY